MNRKDVAVCAVDDHPSWLEEYDGCLMMTYDRDPWTGEPFRVVEAVEASELHEDDRHV